MNTTPPPEGGTHIAKLTIDLYRTPDGTVHYLQDTEVLCEKDPHGEDANIYRALTVIAERDFGPPQQPSPDICAGTGTFGDALEALWSLLYVRRRGWNSKNLWVGLQLPNEHSQMTEPYTYIRTEQGTLRPWQASGADQLSNDWELVPNPPPVETP
jgi:hypothetical protein